MDNLLVILLVVAIVKFIIAAVILWRVFRGDIQEYRAERRESRMPSVPICVYCQSRWTEPEGEAQTRWEDDQLVLVTTYVCQHCNLPFWHVERVRVSAPRH